MIEIKTDEEYTSLLKNKNVLIDMYADWCKPCQKISKPLEVLSHNYPNVTFAKINIEELRFMETGLKEPDQIPCIFYLKDGEVVSTLVTSNMEEIEKALSVFN